MTSRHTSGGGRRGIATWIIVTVVAVVLVVATTATYLLIIDDSDDGGEAACNSQVVLPVVSSPGATAAIAAAAAGFDATFPVARSACVTTIVNTVPGALAGQALVDGWTQQPGEPPAVWVPDSEADLKAVETADSGLTAGRDTTPMATSPVVIAVRTEDAAAVTAAGLSWPDLAAATGPDGTIALPSGRHLLLALPDPTTNRATSYALQSMLAASGQPVDVAAVTAAAADLAAVGAGGPTDQPATTAEALAQLAAGTGGFTAVPVVESDLSELIAEPPGLTGISPAGHTVADAIYPVPLTASWVTPTLDDAAALFAAYLRTPGGQSAFTDHGLQLQQSATDAPSTSGSSTVNGGSTQVELIPDAGGEVATALARAIGATPSG